MVIAEESENDNKIDLKCPEKVTDSDVEETNCDKSDCNKQKVYVSYDSVLMTI